MQYKRMSIEIESPEEQGYGNIKFNLAESSVRDIYLGSLNIDLKNTLLFYGEHKGSSTLREAISEGSFDKDEVLVTTGAATALFIISTTLLNTSDHLIVIRPNYATNLETPRAINCPTTIIDLKFEDRFEIDINEIRKSIQPSTKLISVTNPHNPTGKLFSEETIRQLVALAEEKNCYLLVDETYRELNFRTPLKPYAATLSNKVISVSSLSKAYGAPGIRIGWLITRDKKLLHDFLAAKEQITICNSVVDEAIALHLLQHKQKLLPQHHEHIRSNFAYMKNWMAQQQFLEWVEPEAGVVCFPRLKSEFSIDAAKFYDKMFKDYGTVVGPGHWFERDKTYMRIGFGYPLAEELKRGLDNLRNCLKSSAISSC